MKNIVILGSTGSIGRNALEIIGNYPDKFRVVGLAANENKELLLAQAKKFNVAKIAIYNTEHEIWLKKSSGLKRKIYSGIDGINEIAGLKEADTVLMAIGGTLSLMPLVTAIKAKKRIALASKEALVSAGSIVMGLVKKNKVDMLPVDSEHSAIFQCLNGHCRDELNRIFLTGTGGTLRNIDKSQFDKLPVSSVINHPKWKMGRKITVDSATLMNKGLEVIEAKWLFDVDVKKIKVLIHPEAIIHSMVEYHDGVVMANMFSPDMRFPILYALTYPERFITKLPRVDFCKLKSFTFHEPDTDKFPALNLAYKAANSTSESAVLNAANEEAVNAYLDGKIKFTQIIKTVESVLSKHKGISNPSLDDILCMDKWSKEMAKEIISKKKK